MGKIISTFVCFLLLNSGLVFAATTATSNVKLTDISFILDGVTIDFDYWGDESSSQIYANDSDEAIPSSEDEDNDFADTEIFANFTHAQVSAKTEASNGTPVSLEAHGRSVLDSGNQEAYTAAWSYFWFAVDGGTTGGSITINAHYEMDIDLEANLGTSAYAYADVQMGGDIWPESGDYDWDEVRFLNHTIGSGTYVDSIEGDLSVIMNFDPDSSGEFWWEVESYTSTVPVPSTISLLALGLLGLVGVNRRKKQ